MKKKGRFCCWCGKVEYTELCQSESMKKAVKLAVDNFAEIVGKKIETPKG